jgi:hypothetical protein
MILRYKQVVVERETFIKNENGLYFPGYNYFSDRYFKIRDAKNNRKVFESWISEFDTAGNMNTTIIRTVEQSREWNKISLFPKETALSNFYFQQTNNVYSKVIDSLVGEQQRREVYPASRWETDFFACHQFSSDSKIIFYVGFLRELKNKDFKFLKEYGFEPHIR